MRALQTSYSPFYPSVARALRSDRPGDDDLRGPFDQIDRVATVSAAGELFFPRAAHAVEAFFKGLVGLFGPHRKHAFFAQARKRDAQGLVSVQRVGVFGVVRAFVEIPDDGVVLAQMTPQVADHILNEDLDSGIAGRVLCDRTQGPFVPGEVRLIVSSRSRCRFGSACSGLWSLQQPHMPSADVCTSIAEPSGPLATANMQISQGKARGLRLTLAASTNTDSG